MKASQKTSWFERQANELLAPTGIVIDGPNPWDPQIKVAGTDRTALFARMILERSLGVAETYIEGKWECEDLADFYDRLLRLAPQSKKAWVEWLISLQDLIINRQSHERGKKVGEQHYDIPHELYAPMLGESELYTCAYFKDGITDLTAAQNAKVDMLVKKLKLKPGMKVLDIGCGWGALGEMLIKRCPGIHYIGISISKEQIAIAKKKYAANPNMEFYLMDYRNIPESWEVERVVSLGMIEHVGHRNLRELFGKIAKVLTPDGIALTHFMHGLTPEPNDPFYDKYIFPNSELPTLEHVHRAIDRLLLIKDYHEIGRHYSPTLDAWDLNFVGYWNTLSDEKKADTYGVLFPKFWRDLPINGNTPQETRVNRLKRAVRFYRMWRIYLSSASAVSRSRRFLLFQHLLVKPAAGVPLEDPVR